MGEDMATTDWDECKHEWESNVDSSSGRDCHCSKCDCPGERNEDDTVYWPAS